MRLLRRAQAFESHHLALGHRRDRHAAGAHGFAVDMYGAGAALAKAAAETRAIEPKIVAQHIEQRRLGIIDGEPNWVAIHGQSDLRHRVLSPGMKLSLSARIRPEPGGGQS